MRGNQRQKFAAFVSSLLMGLVGFGEAHGQTQVIPLRSGNAEIGEPDTTVRVLVDGSQRAVAGVDSFARVIKPRDAATARLSTDPVARWIGPGPGWEGDGRIVSYRIPFTVDAGAIASATVELIAMGHGLMDEVVIADVALNGQRIGEMRLTATDVSEFVAEDVGAALTTGANRLVVSVPHRGAEGGLIFSGRVSIWHTAELAAFRGGTEDSGAVAEVSAAGIGVGCTGFVCRPRGDLDSDYDVDAADYSRFEECLSGVGVAAPDGCEDADFECDGKIDLRDAGGFQTAFTGSF